MEQVGAQFTAGIASQRRTRRTAQFKSKFSLLIDYRADEPDAIHVITKSFEK